MAELSPAAQAVNYAYCKVSYDKDVESFFRPLPWEQRAIAAALRAAADALVAHEHWDKYPAIFYRKKLHAIAAELESTTN